MCVLLEAEVTAAGKFQEPSSSGTQAQFLSRLFFRLLSSPRNVGGGASLFKSELRVLE